MTLVGALSKTMFIVKFSPPPVGPASTARALLVSVTIPAAAVICGCPSSRVIPANVTGSPMVTWYVPVASVPAAKTAVSPLALLQTAGVPVPSASGFHCGDAVSHVPVGVVLPVPGLVPLVGSQ